MCQNSIEYHANDAKIRYEEISSYFRKYFLLKIVGNVTPYSDVIVN